MWKSRGGERFIKMVYNRYMNECFNKPFPEHLTVAEMFELPRGLQQDYVWKTVIRIIGESFRRVNGKLPSVSKPSQMEMYDATFIYGKYFDDDGGKPVVAEIWTRRYSGDGYDKVFPQRVLRLNYIPENAYESVAVPKVYPGKNGTNFVRLNDRASSTENGLMYPYLYVGLWEGVDENSTTALVQVSNAPDSMGTDSKGVVLGKFSVSGSIFVLSDLTLNGEIIRSPDIWNTKLYKEINRFAEKYDTFIRGETYDELSLLK